MNELTASPCSDQRPSHLFRPGQSGNPAGRPKGCLGGRALALQTLERVLADPKNQADLAQAIQQAFSADPMKFFRTIIMPLLPQDVKIRMAEEGAIQWVSLATTFPMKSAEPTGNPR